MKLDHAALGPLLFHGSLDTTQATGADALIACCEENAVILKEQIAYVLATAYHETGRHMTGIDEYGRGEGKSYGKVDPDTGQVYFGRGIVQLTWKENYEKFGDMLDLDLVDHPELANVLENAVLIAVIGMRTGGFTGVGMVRFINQNSVDYVNARRVINGLDCAVMISAYAAIFAAHLHEESPQVA